MYNWPGTMQIHPFIHNISKLKKANDPCSLIIIMDIVPTVDDTNNKYQY